MEQIVRENGDNWTESEAQSYCEAHGKTLIAINGTTLVVA